MVAIAALTSFYLFHFLTIFYLVVFSYSSKQFKYELSLTTVGKKISRLLSQFQVCMFINLIVSHCCFIKKHIRVNSF